MPITLLDGILIVIMLISAVLAMIRGFSREVLSIVSWIVAAFAAFYFYPLLSPTVMNLVGDQIGRSETVANIAAAAVVFLVALIIVSYLTMLIADMIIDSRISALDRTLGFIFGAARGLVLVTVAFMGFLWLANDNLPGWAANAKSRPMMESLGTGLRDALPDNLDKLVSGVFKKDKDDGKEGEGEQ